MDDANRLAVTFTSSNGESETGNIGNDLSGSYVSGGTGGTAGTYSNLPTTTSGNGSGMTLQVITDETLKSDPLITLTPAATTLAVNCLFAPTNPSWAFTVGTLGQYVYNSSLSVDFQLDIAEQNTLIINILKYAGIIIKDLIIQRYIRGHF